MKFHEILAAFNSLRSGMVIRTLDASPVKQMPKFENALCFEMPNYEDLSHISAVDELVRLPYEVVWLEGEVGATKWGFLCQTCKVDGGPGMFAQCFRWEAQDAPTWRPTVIVAFHFDSGEWSTPEQVQPLLNVTDGSMDTLKNIDPEMFLTVRDFSRSYIGAFLSLLNCKNVPRIAHPASVALNKKRARNGKPPLFSYWTLDLSASREKGAPHGGTHASPRLHLRRGHFRKYAADKTCWVTPCTVGNKKLGIVHKDYTMQRVDERVH